LDKRREGCSPTSDGGGGGDWGIQLWRECFIFSHKQLEAARAGVKEGGRCGLVWQYLIGWLAAARVGHRVAELLAVVCRDPLPIYKVE